MMILNQRPALRLFAIVVTLVLSSTARHGRCQEAASQNRNPDFERDVRPILEQFCFGCHADGADEGSMSFDEIAQLTDRREIRRRWHRVLKMLRSDLMPPQMEEQPADAQQKVIENWIVRRAFGLDPENPDPGKITVRRLNRVEYENTIRDLLGADFDASKNFPEDNTGEGFDNIANVLTISPLLLEKYFDAAREVVAAAVPTTSEVVRRTFVEGSKFERERDEQPENSESTDETSRREREDRRTRNSRDDDSLELSYYEHVTARAPVQVEFPGEYQIDLDLFAVESYVDNIFDLNECELTFQLDDEELLRRTFVRQGGKRFSFSFARELNAGEHEFVITVAPTTQEDQVRRLRLRVSGVTLRGPKHGHFVKPENYDRFFPRAVPQDERLRRAYARELITDFATRAYRRPVEEERVTRLVNLAESVYGHEGKSFESGIAQAMVAVLASPSFLFREEFVVDGDSSEYPLIDEHSLASRLSYFLWSSMPDDELIRLANSGRLRENLDDQIGRMLRDDRSHAFVENFVGQWLKARSVESIPISARSVLRREAAPDPEAEERRKRFFELYRKGDQRTAEEEREFEEARKAFRERFRREPRVDLTRDIRRAMRRETEMLFEYVIGNDRSLLDLIDANYTFLNEPLAGHYQIEGVAGEEMQLVDLPEESLRGGILTQGTFLVVTSNPDRTSPVKRGLFILENLLGTPPPAPPANIPPLEEAAKDTQEGQQLSLRQTLAIHRENALCSSCHNRMDPLGLALENFNAMGRFRNQEFGQPIDSSGVLISGEPFSSVNDLKEILTSSRSRDFYRCLTEKLMTYALGRAVEYTDVPAIDAIVADLDRNEGRSSILIRGIIHSAAFQRTRRAADPLEENDSSHNRSNRSEEELNNE